MIRLRIVVITQARTGSTRLPAKVTREVLGRPLLAYHLERLKMIKQADEIVVATTGNPKDDIIVNIAEKAGVGWYRGSEDDVLSRYYEAATEYGAEVVVRVTSDCPLIDPEISGRVIQEYVDSFPRFDYVSNTLRRTYPRGLDTEVFSYEILREVNGKAKEPADREHVTRYIIRRPEIYRLGNLFLPAKLYPIIRQDTPGSRYEAPCFDGERTSFHVQGTLPGKGNISLLFF